MELKNNVSPKRQKELQKKVINLEERSLKDKEQLTLLKSKIKNLEITAEPTVQSNIEKDNTSTQTIPDLQSANAIDILFSKIEEKIDVTINKKLAKIIEVESYANVVKHLLTTTANDGNPKNFTR